MSASLCLMAWKDAICRPKAKRPMAYSRAMSSAACAPPSCSKATRTAARSSRRSTRGQPALLLGLAAREEQGLRGEIDRGGERRGGETAAQLLGDDAQLEIAEARATMRFRDGRADPAHLAHAPPQLGVIGRGALEDSP